MTKKQLNQIITTKKKMAALELTTFPGDVEFCAINCEGVMNTPKIQVYKGIRNIAKLCNVEVTVVDLDNDYYQLCFDYAGVHFLEVVNKNGSKEV